MLLLEASNDIRLLAERLAAISPGDMVTLDQLSEAIGRDVRPRRYLIYQAQKRLARDLGILFAPGHLGAYRRLTTEQIPDDGRLAQIRKRCSGHWRWRTTLRLTPAAASCRKSRPWGFWNISRAIRMR